MKELLTSLFTTDASGTSRGEPIRCTDVENDIWVTPDD
jgi:hypothetical protein